MIELNKNKELKFHYFISFYLGLFLRFCIFSFICFFPINLGIGYFSTISPFHYGGLDISIYEGLVNVINNSDGSRNIFFQDYANIFFGLDPSTKYPGPVLPILMIITNYSPGNTFLLSFIIFICEVMAFFLWHKYIFNTVGVIPSYFFSFVPQLIWFGLLTNADIFLYLFSSITILYFLRGTSLLNPKIIFFAFLAIFSKPMGISISIFFLLHAIYKDKTLFSLKVLLYLIIFLLGFLYYLPYFFSEQINLESINPVEIFMTKNGLLDSNSFFYSPLKIIINFLFTFGIHPSETGNFYAFLLRLLTGIIFIIGFLNLIYKKNALSVYALIFIIPIITLFYADWRYIIPLIPIFITYFFIFLKQIRFKLSKIKD